MVNDREERARVLSSRDEPAATGDNELVPEVAAWQEAADSGATAHREAQARVSSSSGQSRPPGPPWTPASAALPAALRTELIDWLRGGLPNEGCGVLIGRRVAEDGGAPSRFVGMRNTAVSPYRYLMDPEEQLRVLLEVDDNDEIVWAIVHSHVASPPVPSMTDVGLAAYPDALYLICSFAAPEPELRGWTIVDGAVNEVVLEPV
jgi:[CysO sulfur-carrier protein]-S-L-cysteine hydrolase